MAVLPPLSVENVDECVRVSLEKKGEGRGRKKVEKDVTCVDLFHFRLFQTIFVLIIIVNLRYDENVNGWNTDKIICILFLQSRALIIYAYNPIEFWKNKEHPNRTYWKSSYDSFFPFKLHSNNVFSPTTREGKHREHWYDGISHNPDKCSRFNSKQALQGDVHM